eukprot:CAMPEP_0117681914 /NCGR_PEP_ID=MMETSP0804-20121206/19291_1 /TAXON_ID=1074897 /ORGANISM="Tetraselmis astigmatica, Strain CCMP880" /LENGTH=409 /DNA_ID=CAMNT_0005491813 /DNA_START=234 /DNA_END=1463 /DNA_ORIENTATION=+
MGSQPAGPGSRESRANEARRVAVCARTFWIFIHAAMISLGVAYGTEFHVAWGNRCYGYLTGLFGLLFFNALVFSAASAMDPGFQPREGGNHKDTNLEKQNSADDSLDPTMGRDTDWLLGQSDGSSRLPMEQAINGSQLRENPKLNGAVGSSVVSSTSCAATRSARARGGAAMSRAQSIEVHPEEVSLSVDSSANLATDDTHVPAGRTCQYCNAWQPLRTKHCHDCNRCVRLFDHHCVWIGNCVGVRNYRAFFLYLVTQFLCIVWGLRIFISGLADSSPRRLHPVRVHGIHSRPQLDLWVEERLPLLAGIAALLFLGLFVLCLLGYHSYLVATNQTTYELIREGSSAAYYLRHVPKGVAPFSRGVAANIRSFLFQGHGWGEDNSMAPASELASMASVETLWNNRYYSCFD